MSQDAVRLNNLPYYDGALISSLLPPTTPPDTIYSADGTISDQYRYVRLSHPQGELFLTRNDARWNAFFRDSQIIFTHAQRLSLSVGGAGLFRLENTGATKCYISNNAGYYAFDMKDTSTKLGLSATSNCEFTSALASVTNPTKILLTAPTTEVSYSVPTTDNSIVPKIYLDNQIRPIFARIAQTFGTANVIAAPSTYQDVNWTVSSERYSDPGDFTRTGGTFTCLTDGNTYELTFIAEASIGSGIEDLFFSFTKNGVLEVGSQSGMNVSDTYKSISANWILKLNNGETTNVIISCGNTVTVGIRNACFLVKKI